jgi:hypothetical protein
VELDEARKMEAAMSEGSNAKEISLGDGFGNVVLRANSIRIELHADGSVDAYAPGHERPGRAGNEYSSR